MSVRPPLQGTDFSHTRLIIYYQLIDFQSITIPEGDCKTDWGRQPHFFMRAVGRIRVTFILRGETFKLIPVSLTPDSLAGADGLQVDGCCLDKLSFNSYLSRCNADYFTDFRGCNTRILNHLCFAFCLDP